MASTRPSIFSDAPDPDIDLSGFAPADFREAAILTTLDPGAYTAIVSGSAGGFYAGYPVTTGVALVEVYEVDHPDTPLINISTRGKVLTGFESMIGGFVIGGSDPLTVVVRAVGPSLGGYGIRDALSNPTLQLVRLSDQVLIGTNDDWVDATNAADIQASGFAPSDSRESAILMTLPPGAYTAIVTPDSRSSGTVGLVEVYKVGP